MSERDQESLSVDYGALCKAGAWQDKRSVVCGAVPARLLAGLTSSTNAIYVRCQCPVCVDTSDELAVHTLDGLIEHSVASQPNNTAPTLYLEHGGKMISFDEAMQQEAKRVHARDLQGVQLWHYRFDTDTLTAAGAPAGQGVWQKAHVCAYHSAQAALEIEYDKGCLLSGTRCTVLPGVCVLHFGEQPPSLDSAPRRHPFGAAAASDSLPASCNKPMRSSLGSALDTDPGASLYGVPLSLVRASPASQGAANSQQQGNHPPLCEQQQQQGGCSKQELARSRTSTPTVSQDVPADTTGRGASRRQAALAAPAAWAASAKHSRAASVDRAQQPETGASAGPRKTAGAPLSGEHAEASRSVSADAHKVLQKQHQQQAARQLPWPYSAPVTASSGLQGVPEDASRPSENRRKRYAASRGGDANAGVMSVFIGDGAEAGDGTNSSSKFKNVLWSKRAGKWQATVSLAGRYRYFGLYNTQEEAACACDRAALVYKGVNAKVLYYPLSTYLEPHQQQLLQALIQEAQLAAARGTMPAPKLSPGDPGVEALHQAAAAQQAAAAAAGAVLQGPPEVTMLAVQAAAAEAVTERPPQDTGRRRRGASGGGVPAAVEEPAAAPSTGDLASMRTHQNRRAQHKKVCAVQRGGRAVSAERGLRQEGLRAGSEAVSLGSEVGAADQGLTQAAASAYEQQRALSEGADVAVQPAATAGDRRKRKHKMALKQLPQKARKPAARDGSSAQQAGGASRVLDTAATPAAMAATSSDGSPDVGQHAPDVTTGEAGDAAAGGTESQVADSRQVRQGLHLEDEFKQQQQLDTVEASSARPLPKGVQRHSGRHSTPDSHRSTPQPERHGVAVHDGVPVHGHATRRASASLRASPPVAGDQHQRQASPMGTVDDTSVSMHSSTPDADSAGMQVVVDDAAAASGDAGGESDDVEAASSIGEGEEHPMSDDERNGDDDSGDVHQGGEEGEEAAAGSTRRSQRQAAKREHCETRVQPADVHNPRKGGGMWGKSMQQGRQDKPHSRPVEADARKCSTAGARKQDRAPIAAKPPRAPRSSHVTPAAAPVVLPAATAVGVSHRPLTRSRTKVKGRGRPRGSKSTTSVATTATAAKVQVAAKPPPPTPGHQPLLAAILAAVADQISDGEGDEEAAAAAAAVAAADAKAKELVDAVMQEAAAGFPHLPQCGDEEETVAQVLLKLGGAGQAEPTHSGDEVSSEVEGPDGDQAPADADNTDGKAAAQLDVSVAAGVKSRKRRRCTRIITSTKQDQDDWAPGRSHKRRNRGRVLAAAAAAGPAAPAVQRNGNNRGRPRSSVPPMPTSATGAAPGAIFQPYYIPTGFFMASMQQQMQQEEDADMECGSDSDDSEGEDGLSAQQRIDQQAQKLVQAMIPAFSSGDPAALAKFQRRYQRVSHNTAALQQVMAYVYQWGQNVGQNLAASGQASCLAAALGSMAASVAQGKTKAAALAAERDQCKDSKPRQCVKADRANNQAAGHASSKQRLAMTAGGPSTTTTTTTTKQQMLKYAELLQTSGGSSSSSVLSESESGDPPAAPDSSDMSSQQQAAAAPAHSKPAPGSAAAAAAQAAAAALAAVKAEGQPARGVPLVPPCLDGVSMKAMMGAPLNSSTSTSSSSSSGDEADSDDDEITALAAKAPRADVLQLALKASTGPHVKGFMDSKGPAGCTDDGAVQGSMAKTSRAATQRSDTAAVTAAGRKKRTSTAGTSTAAAAPSAPTGQHKPGGAVTSNSHTQPVAVTAGMDASSSEAAAAAAAVSMAAGVNIPAAAQGYMQPAGYVVMPGASYYGGAMAAHGHVASNWQWQQMANLQALQQQQLYQQQQAYYYLPQQHLLLQQQQAATRAALLQQQQQQMLAHHAAHKAQGAAPVVLNLQQPPAQQQQLLSPTSAAKSAAATAGKAGGGGPVLGLNLAAPPTMPSALHGSTGTPAADVPCATLVHTQQFAGAQHSSLPPAPQAVSVAKVES